LFINAFSSEENISDLKVAKVAVAVRDMKRLSQYERMLSLSGVANCVFYGDYLYVKGDVDKAIDILTRGGAIMSKTLLRDESLLSQVEPKVTRMLIYSALENNVFQERNWIAPLRKTKRAIPKADVASDNLMVELKDEIIVLFGLKYMIEFRSTGQPLLWLDMYAPVWSRSEARRLSRKELTEELKALYVKKAMLPPHKRHEKIKSILDELFEGDVIKVTFCDGETLNFSKEHVHIFELEEPASPTESFSFMKLGEPAVRFRYGGSYEPRRILRLKPYSYYVIKEIPVKAIVGASEKEDFITFFRYLNNGYSGDYMRWPGFYQVMGAHLILDEDVKEIGGDNLSEYEDALLEMFNEAEENSVIFVIVPENFRFYRKIKALSLQRKRRIQILKTSTLRKEPLEFTLINVANAVYAKAEGTPWLLENPLSATKGLFVGISFHLDHKSKDIYYGAAEVFDNRGYFLKCLVRTYRLPKPAKKVRGLYIPEKEMEDLVMHLIKEYRPRMLIIHKSAKIHEDEKRALENIRVKNGIDYCLVHIENSNPYRIYVPRDQPNYMPLRGTIIFDKEKRNRTIMLTTGQAIGDRGDIKTITKIGSPKPLEINIEENKTPHNVREISEQILALTKLDWNTTNIAVRTPITIKYSNKAARLAPYLMGGEKLLSINDIRDLL